MEINASVFIVTDKGMIVEPVDFDRKEHGAGEFVMLTNDSLNPEYGDDNSICLHYKWQA